MFDFDSFEQSLEPPRAQLDGHVYIGRVLSIEEWEPYRARAAELEEAERNGKGDSAAFTAFAAEYLRAIFPTPPWWKVWVRDPVPRMLTHAGLVKALYDFFAHQARAIALMSGASPTAGTDSPS